MEEKVILNDLYSKFESLIENKSLDNILYEDEERYEQYDNPDSSDLDKLNAGKLRKMSSIQKTSLPKMPNNEQDKIIYNNTMSAVNNIIRAMYGNQLKYSKVVSPLRRQNDSFKDYAYKKIGEKTYSIVDMYNDLNEEEKYPVYVYDNPRYVPDQDEALRANAYYEARRLIMVMFPDKFSDFYEIGYSSDVTGEKAEFTSYQYMGGSWKMYIGKANAVYAYQYDVNREELIILSTGMKSKSLGAISPENFDTLLRSANNYEEIINESVEDTSEEFNVALFFKGGSLRKFNPEYLSSLNEMGGISVNGMNLENGNRLVFYPKPLAKKGLEKVLDVVRPIVSNIVGINDPDIQDSNFENMLEQYVSDTNYRGKYEIFWERPLITDSEKNDFWAIRSKSALPRAISDFGRGLISTSGRTLSITNPEEFKTLILQLSELFPKDIENIKNMYFSLGLNTLGFDKEKSVFGIGSGTLLDDYAAITFLANGYNPAFGKSTGKKKSESSSLVCFKLNESIQESHIELFFSFVRPSVLYCFDVTGKPYVTPVDLDSAGNVVYSNRNIGETYLCEAENTEYEVRYPSQNMVGKQVTNTITVDHINGVHTHNQISNLRLATNEYNNYRERQRGAVGYRIVYNIGEIESYIQNMGLDMPGSNVPNEIYWNMAYDQTIKAPMPVGYWGRDIVLSYENGYSISIGNSEDGKKNEFNIASIQIIPLVNDDFQSGVNNDVTEKTDTITISNGSVSISNNGRKDYLYIKLIDVLINKKKDVRIGALDMKESGDFVISTSDYTGEIQNNQMIKNALSHKNSNISVSNNLNKNDIASLINDRYSSAVSGGAVRINENRLYDPVYDTSMENYVKGVITEGSHNTLMKDIQNDSTFFELGLKEITNLLNKEMKIEIELQNREKVQRRITSLNANGKYVIVQLGIRMPNDIVTEIESDPKNWRTAAYVKDGQKVACMLPGKKANSPAIFFDDFKGSPEIDENIDNASFEVLKYEMKDTATGALQISVTGQRRKREDSRTVSKPSPINYTTAYPTESGSGMVFWPNFIPQDTPYKKVLNSMFKDRIVASKPGLHILSATAWKSEQLLEAYSDYVKVSHCGTKFIPHHINGITSNFSPTNLVWVSGQDNTTFESGVGVAAYRIEPGSCIEVPIMAWSSKSEFDAYLRKNEENGIVYINDIIPAKQEAYRFPIEVKNVNKMLKMSARKPKDAQYRIVPGEDCPFSYCIRNVILKDVERIKKTPMKRIEDVLAVEQITDPINGKGKSVRKWVSVDDPAVTIFIKKTSLSLAQKVREYLKGRTGILDDDNQNENDEILRSVEEYINVLVAKTREEYRAGAGNGKGSWYDYITKRIQLISVADLLPEEQMKIWNIENENALERFGEISATMLDEETVERATSDILNGILNPDCLTIGGLYQIHRKLKYGKSLPKSKIAIDHFRDFLRRMYLEKKKEHDKSNELQIAIDLATEKLRGSSK